MSPDPSISTQAVNASDSAHVNSYLTNFDTLTDMSNTVFSLTSGPVQSQTHGGGIGYGTASVDIITGELKAQVTGAADGGENTAGIAATGFVEITETFNVVGTGTVTALLDVSGNWEGLTSSWQIQAKAQILGGFSGAGLDNVQLSPGNGSPSSGSINQTLQAQRTVLDGQQISLVYMLLVQAGSVAFDIDFMNTANAFYVLDGVELAPVAGVTDSRFLSDPAFSPVPLPAALPLLLSALGFFGFFGWRRKRIAAA
jgi:hypothetical protein